MVSPKFNSELDTCFQHQGSVWVGWHAGLPLYDQGAAHTHTHRIVTSLHTQSQSWQIKPGRLSSSLGEDVFEELQDSSFQEGFLLRDGVGLIG